MSADFEQTCFEQTWRSQLPASLAEVMEVADKTPEVDLVTGPLATAVLWPIRGQVQEFDGEAIDAIRAIAGAQSKQILRAVQTWGDDQVAAARALASAAHEDPALAGSLAALVAHFDAASMLSASRGVVPAGVINQINAALVNVGGTINIQRLTLNITRPVEIPTPPRPDRPPHLDEFVGRVRELAYYGEMLSTHHLAIISGMAGVGKTSLAAALALHSTVVDRIFWHSFREREGIEVIIWKLAAFLAWHGQDELWRMLHSAHHSGAQPPDMLFDYLLPMVAGHAYLLCFDDLHLVEEDPLLARLLDRLRTVLADGTLSLVVTTRRIPAFVQMVTPDPLPGLHAQDARLLLSHWGVALPEPLFERLHAYTSGNAQFLVLATNLLQQETDLAGAIDRLAGSNDLERYLLSEVDERLTGNEQLLMGATAVLLGEPCTADAIEALMGGENVRRTLRQLADRHLLLGREGERGREYQLHAIVQAFYYDLLSQPRRRSLHLRAAAFYETDEPDLMRAAIHHERGGDFARCAQLVTENLDTLITRGHLRRLRGLLAQDTAGQLEPLALAKVHVALGRICGLLAEGQAAREYYQRALDQLSGLEGNPDAASLGIQVLRGMGQLTYNEQPQEAMLWLQRAFVELERAGDQADPSTAAGLYIDMGWAQRRLHNMPEATTALQRGLELLPPEPGRLRGDALTRLAALYVAQYDLENARRYAELAVENSRYLQDVWHEQTVLSLLGNIQHANCDWKGAIQHYVRALALAAETGDHSVQAALEVNLGVAHTNLGDTGAALTHLARGLDLSKRGDLQSFQLKGQLAAANLHIRMRNWMEAESCLNTAKELVHKTATADAEFHLPLILSAQAELHLLAGSLQEAAGLAEASVALAIEQEKVVDLAICRRVQGQVLIATGDDQQAAALLGLCLAPLEGRHRLEAAKVEFYLGQALGRTGHVVRGQELMAKARTAFAALEARFELDQLVQ